jgi:pullulanase/glycogen debranching enzyme
VSPARIKEGSSCKLLLDPYARAHAGRLEWNAAVFGYRMESRDDLSFDERDSAPFVPKSVIVDPNFDWKGEPTRKHVPWDDTILYEMHVKGFTQRHPGIEQRLRGTYEGLGTREVIEYIRSLGISSVELLPVHTFVNDSLLVERGLTNYWGYNTIGFFAPDPRYAADVQEMHVDGFRFDLGTILAREPNGFDNRSGFLKACSQDPLLRTVKLIAEPWDCGPGGYQVGAFPPGWAEWNDKFRDTVRDFWRGEAPASALAPRLCASGDLYNHQGRRPWASVNFITAHDGFTLNDLVSYNERHNEANQEGNRDGHSDNRSWNCGAEGPTEDPGINALRERQIRNLLATLLLAQGTPMLLAGDELGRTQGGNNNSYCQDNEISWLDWSVGERGQNLLRFVKRLIRLRHTYPILRRNRFLTGEYNPELEVKDVTWINATGAEMQEENWRDAATRCFGMLMDGRAQSTGIRQRGKDATLLLVLNAHHDVVKFTLPACPGGAHWSLLLDSNRPAAPPARFSSGSVYEVTARSLLLLENERDAEAV